MTRRRSGETEYQGQFLAWLKQELSGGGYAFEDATQEFPNRAGKRSDVIVWINRASNQGILEIELKTPTTPLRNPELQKDAIEKARAVTAPYLALSNMRETALFRTPAAPRVALLPEDKIKDFQTIEAVRSVEDWIDPTISEQLKARARTLLWAAHDLHSKGSLDGVVVDATVFVDALKEPVSSLSAALRGDVSVALKRRKISAAINSWAKEQGLTFFVSDLAAALAGQLAYRITGQILFYYGFRRHHPELPPLSIEPEDTVSAKLRTYWDVIRGFDYEALFEPSPLEDVPLSTVSETRIRALVEFLSAYDWNDIDVDVLGSIFEQLLPPNERIVLGQYYTPPALADLLLSASFDDEVGPILDPAVGSGTFLLRAYDRLRRKHGYAHVDALEILWGGDISAFPAELAVINLCRQDLRSYTNYPRIMVRDFFRLEPDDVVRIPSAQRMPGGAPMADVKLPKFNVIAGNPPYVRSQQLDDLDTSYKVLLHRVAKKKRVDDSKFDAFAYFVLHATDFLNPGGRLAFVTSASWLTTEFGARLQRYVLRNFAVRAVIFSQVEPFFPFQEVNTVALIASKRDEAVGPTRGEKVRFVTLTDRLSVLLPPQNAPDYWRRIDLWVDEMLAASEGTHPGFKISFRSAMSEWKALTVAPKQARNWALPFRESSIYRDLFEKSADERTQ